MNANSSFMPIACSAAQKEIADDRNTQEIILGKGDLVKDILNSIPMGIIIIDPKTHSIVDANTAAIKMIGVSREILAGTICHQHICPAEIGKCPITDLGQRVDSSERILLNSRGDRIPIIKNVDRIALGEREFLLESFVGNTERKRAGGALAISEARYRTLFENSANPIVVLEEDTTISLANAEANRLLGYRSEDLEGKKNWTEFIHKDDLMNMKRYLSLQKTNPSATPEKLEFRMVDGNGVLRFLLMTIAKLPGSEQSIASLLDVTDRRRAEDGLKDSEEKYRDLFESASDLIQSVGPDGKFIYVNRAWIDTLGYSEMEIDDLSMMKIVHPESLEHCSNIFRQLMGGKKFNLVEAAFQTKDGRKILVEGSVNSKFVDGRMIYTRGIFRNVTERKDAEDALSDVVKELKRSNNELEQFAYVTSHDLQEPLRMVTSFLGLLSKKYRGKLDQDADEYIDFAVDGARRMQNMISDLLAYSRIGTRGKPFEAIDSEYVLKQALNNLQVAIEESGALVTHDPLPTVLADSSQLTQLFQNLVANAIKFRSKDGSPKVHISAEINGEELVFSVRDNGIGIGQEFFEQIFVIFQRLHGRDEYPGSGMGLAICRKIVERHGGRIWVESKIGQGTAFYFTLRGIGR